MAASETPVTTTRPRPVGKHRLKRWLLYGLTDTSGRLQGPHAEIAEILRMTPAAVHARMSRLRRKYGEGRAK